MVPARRLPDGGHLCQNCVPKNLQECGRCHRTRRVNVHTPEGPVCGRCHTSPPHQCGVCGVTAPIVARATAACPDTCARCYREPAGLRAVCRRVRPGHRSDRGRGVFHCHTCTPRPVRTCALCARTGPTKVTWPLGRSVLAATTSTASHQHPAPGAPQSAFSSAAPPREPACAPPAATTRMPPPAADSAPPQPISAPTGSVRTAPSQTSSDISWRTTPASFRPTCSRCSQS